MCGLIGAGGRGVFVCVCVGGCDGVVFCFSLFCSFTIIICTKYLRDRPPGIDLGVRCRPTLSLIPMYPLCLQTPADLMEPIIY